MAKYNPIRTTNPDLSRVQDRIRDTANATTAKLNSLQDQVNTVTKVTVESTSTSMIASAETHVTLVDTTAGMVIQLPDASQVSTILYYKNKSASNALTLKTASFSGRQQLVDGAVSITVAVSTTTRLVSDDTDFHTL